jgi:hypothetical protein
LLVFGQFVLEKLRVWTVFEKTLFGTIANDATLKKNLKKTKKKNTSFILHKKQLGLGLGSWDLGCMCYT